MSTSAISPLTDRIARLRQLGSTALNTIEHPVDAFNHAFGSDAQHQQSHEQAIQQMNQGLNAHRNDAANQSFQKPDLSTMKKPLGK